MTVITAQPAMMGFLNFLKIILRFEYLESWIKRPFFSRKKTDNDVQGAKLVEIVQIIMTSLTTICDVMCITSYFHYRSLRSHARMFHRRARAGERSFSFSIPDIWNLGESRKRSSPFSHVTTKSELLVELDSFKFITPRTKMHIISHPEFEPEA